MEKVLVTGVAGQLGYDVVNVLNARGIACRGVDIADFDLTDEQAVLRYVRAYEPTAIVHCAAFTAVDKAEEAQEAAYAVNVLGTKHIAQAAREVNAKLMYISTDYVFGGDKEGFYDAADEKDPIGVYGKTKYEGELACMEQTDKLFIVRLSWVFGKNGHNFVKTMLRLAQMHEEVRVVNDQFGSPTYTPDAARLICDMIATEKYGAYNVANAGFCSWCEFAAAIFKTAGLTTKAVPITTEEYGAKAKRPKNSRFSKKEITERGFEQLPAWEDALARYLKELEETL